MSEIRAILLLFLILFLIFFLTITEFDYINIILIVKSMRSNATASLRSKYNINRLKLFYFEVDISSILRNKNNRYDISKQYFRIDFNSNSEFLRLKNMSLTNDNEITTSSINNDY